MRFMVFPKIGLAEKRAITTQIFVFVNQANTCRRKTAAAPRMAAFLRRVAAGGLFGYNPPALAAHLCPHSYLHDFKRFLLCLP